MNKVTLKIVANDISLGKGPDNLTFKEKHRYNKNSTFHGTVIIVNNITE